MADISDLIAKITAFRDARDWKQFHNPKDCAISLSLETSELLEHFQWKNKEEIEAHVAARRDEIGEELADVLYWVLLMANDLGIDITEAVKRKLEKNEQKYPIDKAKGVHTKYTNL